MRLGFMYWGEIERHEGESLATKFLVLGPLLLPLATFYRYKGKSYDVPLNGRSVLMGYLQAYSTMGALAGLICLGVSPRLGTAWAGVGALLMAACGAVAYLAHFKWPRLSEVQLRRRELLRQVTGLSGLPGVMPELMTKQIYSGLKRTWSKRWQGWKGQECWKKTLAAGTTRENMGFLAVLATYANALEPSELHANLEGRAWAWLDEHGEEESAAVRDEASQAASLLARVEDAGQERSARAERERQREERRRQVIRLQCPRCEHVSRVPRSVAGTRGLCPSCKGVIEVPGKRKRRAA